MPDLVKAGWYAIGGEGGYERFRPQLVFELQPGIAYDVLGYRLELSSFERSASTAGHGVTAELHAKHHTSPCGRVEVRVDIYEMSWHSPVDDAGWWDLGVLEPGRVIQGGHRWEGRERPPVRLDARLGLPVTDEGRIPARWRTSEIIATWPLALPASG